MELTEIIEGLRRRRQEGYADLDEISFGRCEGSLMACQLEPLRELVRRLTWDDTVVACTHEHSMEVCRFYLYNGRENADGDHRA